MLTRPDSRENDNLASDSTKRAGWKVAAAVVASCATIIGVLAVAFPKQFAHQVEISVARQPTPYTQLFFNDPSVLPTQLPVHKKSKFAFTITNDEGHSVFYQYDVTMSNARSSEVVRRGSVMLANNGTATFTVAIEPKTRKSRYLINVVLIGEGQSIHFYGGTS